MAWHIIPVTIISILFVITGVYVQNRVVLLIRENGAGLNYPVPRHSIPALTPPILPGGPNR